MPGVIKRRVRRPRGLVGIRPGTRPASEDSGLAHTLGFRIRRSLRWRGLGGTLGRVLSDASVVLDLPTLCLSHFRDRAPNALELRVFAPRRSGHHAIMQWVVRNKTGRTVFLNDIRPPYGNPFLDCRGLHVYDGVVDHRYLLRRREAAGKFSRKGTLIYNYEDFELLEDVIARMDADRRAWVGPSERFLDVLILRDPFNLLASVLRARRARNPRDGEPAMRKAVRIWKTCAREFAGRTRYLTNPLFISYNDWFASDAYRRELADKLGLVSVDEGLDQVARWGPATWTDGASFDGLALDGNASQMRVLERWRAYEDDGPFRAQFRDDELWDLSTEIFGRLPGTETLRKATAA